MRKPILQLTSTTMGNILVVRSPFARRWLFNISVSANLFKSKKIVLIPIITALLLLTACDNPTQAKERYHYIHSSDTTYNDSPFVDNTAYLATDPLSEDSLWTSASVAIYQDSIHWTLGSVTLSKPNPTSTKPVIWDGDYIKVPLDRIPANWSKLVITFSRKEVIQ